MAKDLVLILIIALTVFFVFYQTLKNDFVYDDWFSIQSNIAIRKTVNPIYYFTHPVGFSWPREGADADTYRPLEYVVFALTYKFFDLDPFYFHLISLVFHALNAILVFVLLGLIFGSTLIAFFGALIFGLHPINVETVVWATQQGGVLAMFFLLLALIMLLFKEKESQGRPKEKPFIYYFALFLTSSFAVFFKEHAVVLPALYVVISFFRGISIKKRLPEIVAISLPAILAIVLRTIYLPSFAQQGPWGGGRMNMLLTMLSAFKYYIRLLVWPDPLSVNYDAYPVLSKVFNFEFFLSAFLLCFLAVGAWALRKTAPNFSLGVFWFFIALSPVSNVIFPMKQILNERFLYFALPGFMFAVLGAACLVRKKLVDWMRRKLFMLFVYLSIFIFVATLAFLSVRRVKDWKNDETLWSRELKVPLSANSRRTYNNYALTLEMAGRSEESVSHLYKALELAPTLELKKSSIKSLADVLMRNGKEKEAIALLNSALIKDFPDDPALKFALTFAHFYKKEYDFAEKGFREAVESGKYDMTTLMYMILAETFAGTSKEKIQKDIDAITHEALRRAMPDLVRAKTEMSQKNWNAALESLDRVREVKNLPMIEPYLWRGEVLENLGRLEEAEESYLVVIHFYPRSIDAVRGLRRIQSQIYGEID